MRVSSIRWGVILVGLGLVFLAINLGYLSHSVWFELVSLWPVLVIAIGIELIFKRTKIKFLGLLSPLLNALAFIYAASVDSSIGGWSCSSWRFSDRYEDRDYRREVFDYDLESDPSIKSLEVNIDFGVGELWIGPTSDKLFSGDFEYRYRKPKCWFNSSGGNGRIKIKTKDHKQFNIFSGNKFKNDARIFIADYIPLDLELDIAAAKVELDFSELIVKKLKLDTGAAKIDLRLGCQSADISIDIDSGASQVIIEVPREMGLEIDSDAALSSTNFKDIGLIKHHGKYRSDNFNSAGCKASIAIDSGVSQIEIEYY